MTPCAYTEYLLTNKYPQLWALDVVPQRPLGRLVHQTTLTLKASSRPSDPRMGFEYEELLTIKRALESTPRLPSALECGTVTKQGQHFVTDSTFYTAALGWQLEPSLSLELADHWPSTYLIKYMNQQALCLCVLWTEQHPHWPKS